MTWYSAAQRLDGGAGWVCSVHPWAPSPSSALAHGARAPSAAERPRACSIRRRTQKPPVRGRWRNDPPQRRAASSPVEVRKRAFAALGPNDGGAKAGFEAALQHAKAKVTVTPSRAPAPEVTIEAARVSCFIRSCRPYRTRSALTAALTRARAAASHATAPPIGVPDASPEVAHLRGMVSQLQAQLAKYEGGPAGHAMDGVVQESLRANLTKRPEKVASQRSCRQEDFVPTLRRGNAGVDGGASSGPPFGHGILPTFVSCEDLFICDGNCSGLASPTVCPTTRLLYERHLAKVDLPHTECCTGGGTPVWFPRMPCGRSNQPRSRQQAAPVAEIEGVTVSGR